MTIRIDIQAEVLRLFHAERWKIGTIAAQLGIHHSAVRRVLARNGVKLPPPRRATKTEGPSPGRTRGPGH